MKLLTSNFLTCAVKGCRGHPDAYPLHFSECTLEHADLTYQPAFIRNMMPRIDWSALLAVCRDLGNTTLPLQPPDLEGTGTGTETPENDGIGQALHRVLLGTSVTTGKMTCGKCGHVYPIKEGIANMLLAEHEVV